jgi:hypothetical protein
VRRLRGDALGPPGAQPNGYSAVLLAVCLGASSSRWINDINLWVVGAPTGNRFIDFLAVFFKKSEPDIAGERENGGAAARRPHRSRALSTRL